MLAATRALCCSELGQRRQQFVVEQLGHRGEEVGGGGYVLHVSVGRVEMTSGQSLP